VTGAEDRDERTILVVDDAQDILILLKLMLETHGYRALLAPGAEAALRFLRQDELIVDLLLTDVVMPGMNGTDLARAVRELRPGLPVLFMSGYVDTDAVHLKVWDDAVSCLKKPFTEEALLGKVREILGAVPLPAHTVSKARGVIPW
jgi:two-component system, cell cycle sensor histidine kinase and response regulator CckA